MSALLDPKALDAHRWQNTVHTALLFAGLSAIVALSATMLFGGAGLAWAAILLGITLLMMPSIPPELLMRMYRARQVLPQPGDQLSEVLDILVERAGLAQRPRLYVVPSLALNAFAAGKTTTMPSPTSFATSTSSQRRYSTGGRLSTRG